MPGYISEFNYFGVDAEEFVEVAVPAGTDTSAYAINVYAADGTWVYSFGLGAPVATIGGMDVYLIDDTTPGFDSGGDPTGIFYPDDGIALNDGSSTLQFVSYLGNTVTATSGPDAGQTSTNVGTIATRGNSLQSDDDGASYYEQSSSNPGTIPACYATGTLIETPNGYHPVEGLKAGDAIKTLAGNHAEIIEIFEKEETLGSPSPKAYPILIKAGALGLARPFKDLVVSPNHRILIGGAFFVPAKFLIDLKGVRHLRGKKTIKWHHFACAAHHSVRANGAASESLLLGPVFLDGLPRRRRTELEARYGQLIRRNRSSLNGPLAYPTLSKVKAKAYLKAFRDEPDTQPISKRARHKCVVRGSSHLRASSITQNVLGL